MELDVYGQIALVMLIGLVAKNAILVVEFAKELRDQGKGIIEAATAAARLRLRPVLMTSFSFIIGLLPLMVATGPGSISRQSIGTAVVGGLAFATITIMFVPVFFVIIERLREGWTSRGKDQTVAVDNPSDTAAS
jgi:HAE1 family hydrophobic/amphiphilic exporter-1